MTAPKFPLTLLSEQSQLRSASSASLSTSRHYRTSRTSTEASSVYMAQNDGPTKISDIKARFNKTDSYVGNYRRRLLDAEMITTTGHGEVDFALPYMRDYLREHAASLIVEDFDSQ